MKNNHQTTEKQQFSWVSQNQDETDRNWFIQSTSCESLSALNNSKSNQRSPGLSILVAMEHDAGRTMASMLGSDVQETGEIVDIVHKLGGVENVLGLCLNNEEYIEKHISDVNLGFLKQRLERYAPNHDDDDADHDDIEDDTVSLDILLTPAEYEKQKKTRVVKLDARNNLYFDSCLNISKPCSRFWFYEVLTPRRPYYAIISSIIYVFLPMINESVEELDNIADIMYSFVLITYLLSINKDIASMVIDTFDFWYKMFNVVCGCVSLGAYVLYRGDSVFTLILYVICSFLAGLLLCLADGLAVSYCNKMLISVFGTAALVFQAFWYYFVYEDIKWDPIGWSDGNNIDTAISWKSMAISSRLAFAAFTAKPAIHWIKKRAKCKHFEECCCNCNWCDDPYEKQGSKKIKSFFLNYRPFLKWNNATVDLDH